MRTRLMIQITVECGGKLSDQATEGRAPGVKSVAGESDNCHVYVCISAQISLG